MSGLSDWMVQYQGVLPYASESFGVYQPLLGWRSKLKQQRLDRERIDISQFVLHQMVKDPRLRRKLPDPRGLLGPDTPVPPKWPPFAMPGVRELLDRKLERFVTAKGRFPSGPRELAAIIPSRREVKGMYTDGLKEDRVALRRMRRGNAGNTVRGSGYASNVDSTSDAGKMEDAIAASGLRYLLEQLPNTLNALLRPPMIAPWEQAKWFMDPEWALTPTAAETVLSPVGVVNLYRQYFFDLGNVEGPPVEHVWVSPGSTVELFEVHTRSSREEKESELTLETSTRMQRATNDQEDISTAVTQDNQTDTHLGASASGGFGFGVVHGEASGEFSLDQSLKVSEQTAHKKTREQSEQLTQEMRRSSRTRIRTTLETTDTFSRRYTIQNSSKSLRQYELRRKMRLVGVQVQHTDTRLCWQVYIDDPGFSLAIPQLVHIAKPAEADPSVSPPEAPPQLSVRNTDITILFPWEPLTKDAGATDVYVNGRRDNQRIRWKKTFTAVPPAPGYTLSAVTTSSFQKVDPDNNMPEVTAKYVIDPAKNSFEMQLLRADYNDQSAIRAVLQLVWSPPDQSAAAAEYQIKLKAAQEKESRASRQAYVAAVRERIQLASEVRPRPWDDLREEERSVVFRRLMSQLTRVEVENDHLLAEMIRSIFNLDEMLYFVADDWAKPKQRVLMSQTHSDASADEYDKPVEQFHIGPSDLVQWGSDHAAGREHYLITESSQPANLGASLGWLLQLDGDEHRNAFLNSPWVKAVLPVRRGREREAIEWLKRAHVEGSDGLSAAYAKDSRKTIAQALLDFADEVTGLAAKNTSDAGLATETVYYNGFDPLEGGFRASGKPFEVFDQWVEIVPTDQIVARPYDHSTSITQADLRGASYSGPDPAAGNKLPERVPSSNDSTEAGEEDHRASSPDPAHAHVGEDPEHHD
jgi:hypothetical protein